MSDDLEQSPGLALGGAPEVPAPFISIASLTPPPEPRARRTRAPRQQQPMHKLSLAERAKALDKRKRAVFDVTFRIDEVAYDALVSLAERVSLRVNDTARRCFLDGLRRYAELPMPRTPLVDEDYMPDPPGYVFDGLHDPEAAGYREAVATRDPEQEKKFLKQLGLSMAK